MPRGRHQHERWQLQESAKGGMYCAACGEDVNPDTLETIMSIPQWAELTPSYGRDYTSAAKAKADFFAGKDFTFAATGQQMSILDCDLGSTVYLRYKKLTQLTPVTVTMKMLSDARATQEAGR